MSYNINPHGLIWFCKPVNSSRTAENLPKCLLCLSFEVLSGVLRDLDLSCTFSVVSFLLSFAFICPKTSINPSICFNFAKDRFTFNGRSIFRETLAGKQIKSQVV